ncbi:hypothetical protein [Halobacillus karajensis]|nr:hypothetical protein [Halobacillus karajensis]
MIIVDGNGDFLVLHSHHEKDEWVELSMNHARFYEERKRSFPLF